MALWLNCRCDRSGIGGQVVNQSSTYFRKNRWWIISCVRLLKIWTFRSHVLIWKRNVQVKKIKNNNLRGLRNSKQLLFLDSIFYRFEFWQAKQVRPTAMASYSSSCLIFLFMETSFSTKYSPIVR